MRCDHGLVAARGRSGEALRVGVRDASCRSRSAASAARSSRAPSMPIRLLGDVEQGGDVVRSEYRGGVVARLCSAAISAKRAPTCLAICSAMSRCSPSKTSSVPSRSDGSSDRRQRLQRMEREAAAKRGERAAGVKDDGVRFGDRRRDLVDGAIAHGDEDQIAGRRQLRRIGARRAWRCPVSGQPMRRQCSTNAQAARPLPMMPSFMRESEGEPFHAEARRRGERQRVPHELSCTNALHFVSPARLARPRTRSLHLPVPARTTTPRRFARISGARLRRRKRGFGRSWRRARSIRSAIRAPSTFWRGRR